MNEQRSGTRLLRPVRLRPADVLRSATAGLRARPTRSALSALGIAIGIAAIVSVLGISASSQANLVAELGRLGNLLTVSPGQDLSGNSVQLPATAEAMIRRIPPVQSAAAVATLPNIAVYRSAAIPSQESGGISVSAADPALLDTVGGSVASGEFLNVATAHFPAVVLGWSAAQVLGVGDLRLPMQVDISGTYFTVVGILRPVPLVPEIDNSVLIGFPAARSVFGYAGGPTSLYLRSYPDQVAAVQSVLAATANPAQPNAVQVSRPSDVLVARAAAQSTFRLLVLGLGAVAVAIGAVGVANVMVISVLERRGEIGLNRALGATSGQVGLQFATEAVLLAGLGGVAGTLLGVLATVGYAAASSQPATIPQQVVWAGLAGSLAVGGLAGLYPALRAARLAPAVALRAL
jgi:putative ABC transport system permease protein